jgi:hypothetical protein
VGQVWYIFDIVFQDYIICISNVTFKNVDLLLNYNPVLTVVVRSYSLDFISTDSLFTLNMFFIEQFVDYLIIFKFLKFVNPV